MTYKIHCTNCMREWVIDEPVFDQIVRSIEDLAGKMSDVLHRNNVPASYKSHCHVSPILETLMRCCATPEISLFESEENCSKHTLPDPIPTIVADIATLTARVSEAETTASPTAAVALSQVRQHLLMASVGAELSQETQAEPPADIPTITPEMVEETKTEIEKRRTDRPGSPLKAIMDAPCPKCGAHAVSFANNLAFDKMILGTQGVVSVNIPNLTGIRCSKCGDYAFGADASKEITRAVAEARGEVQAVAGAER